MVAVVVDTADEVTEVGTIQAGISETEKLSINRSLSAFETVDSP